MSNLEDALSTRCFLSHVQSRTCELMPSCFFTTVMILQLLGLWGWKPQYNFPAIDTSICILVELHHVWLSEQQMFVSGFVDGTQVSEVFRLLPHLIKIVLCCGDDGTRGSCRMSSGRWERGGRGSACTWRIISEFLLYLVFGFISLLYDDGFAHLLSVLGLRLRFWMFSYKFPMWYFLFDGHLRILFQRRVGSRRTSRSVHAA